MIPLRCECGFERVVPDTYGGPPLLCPTCNKPLGVKEEDLLQAAPGASKLPPMVWIAPFLIGGIIVSFVLMQWWGFMCKQMLPVESFNIRPDNVCDYKPCGEPVAALRNVSVIVKPMIDPDIPVPAGRPGVTDVGLELCSYHSRCAGSRWPEESGSALKYPLQILFALLGGSLIALAAALILNALEIVPIRLLRPRGLKRTPKHGP
jgi:hypothetical protein